MYRESLPIDPYLRHGHGPFEIQRDDFIGVGVVQRKMPAIPPDTPVKGPSGDRKRLEIMGKVHRAP